MKQSLDVRDRLIRILRELLEYDPIVPIDERGDTICLYCNAFNSDKHYSDCLWIRVNEALSEYDNAQLTQ
jgi:hypothetical protein